MKNDMAHKLKLLRNTLGLNNQQMPQNENNPPDKQKNIKHTFTEGHCYRIFSASTTSNSGSTAPKFASAGISWEKQCIFVFLRKDGKHHVFKELNGGWTRTYTDAQLIGKKIMEVQP